MARRTTPSRKEVRTKPKAVPAPAAKKTAPPATPLAPSPPPAAVQQAVAAIADTALELALAKQIPADWRAALAEEFRKPYFLKLQQFLDAQRQAGTVLPPEEEVFQAFRLTPYGRVKVVLLGQEPWAGKGQAHGLSFSVRPGAESPPEQAALFQELRDDLGCWLPHDGDLMPWARQGVLLLNSVLTVRADEPDAHKGKGWESFTDAVLRAVSALPGPVVFVLWGEGAAKKQKLIDESRHVVLTTPPPSEDDFGGSRPFSAVNDALELRGQSAVYWQLPAW
jgi:uracil-DNA glycosylase